MIIEKIKTKIRNSYLGEIMILKLHQMESNLLPKLVSDEQAVKNYYRSRTGRELDLNAPKSFTEKLNWYKLAVHDPLMTVCADKYAVRQYISEKGYGDTLNELYGVYENVEELDLNSLPEKFILKAAHGSHMNLVVKAKANVDWKREKHLMSLWLKQDIYWSGREWVYKNIPKRLIAEKYLGDSLKDYKFYCFNGIPRYLDVDADRYTNHIRNYYDMDWNIMTLECSLVRSDHSVVIEKPVQFEKMKEMATKLSEPFPFVRVDLYEVEGKVYFGELTFYQDGGFPGYPEAWDKKIGEMWNTENQAGTENIPV